MKLHDKVSGLPASVLLLVLAVIYGVGTGTSMDKVKAFLTDPLRVALQMYFPAQDEATFLKMRILEATRLLVLWLTSA
jgi:hypothetical protein